MVLPYTLARYVPPVLAYGCIQAQFLRFPPPPSPSNAYSRGLARSLSSRSKYGWVIMGSSL